MSTFEDKKLLEEANDKIKQLTINYKDLYNSYKELADSHKEQSEEINKLTNELNFFHREMRQHKQEWENMFFSPSAQGYAFEEEKLERKRANSK
jgi:hypothetical protein